MSIIDVHITGGLDLRIAGAPDQTLPPEEKSVKHYAVTGADYAGMKPTILVEIGEEVLAGQPLLEDKKNPGVKFVSPVAGKVIKVARGEKRAFLSIVVEAGPDPTKSLPFERVDSSKILDLCPNKTRELLQRSGLWTALRTRPFSRVPAVGAPDPAALFVNVADSNPLAHDPMPIVEARRAEFLDGLRLLSRICGKTLYVCFGNGDCPNELVAEIEKIPHAKCYRFTGKHPSGLVGTHIAKLESCGLNKYVWSIGYQDAIAIGEALATGVYPSSRVVSLSGPCVKKPRLIRARQGAFVTELVENELTDGPVRVVSGGVLCGRAIVENQEGLGRFANQIVALSDENPSELFGWLMPQRKKFSVARLVASSWFSPKTFEVSTGLEGGKRAIFPNPAFKKVAPLGIEPLYLFKALELMQFDRCEQLGAFELDEEDVALCTLVDLGKNDYGKTLRAFLDAALKEEV